MSKTYRNSLASSMRAFFNDLIAWIFFLKSQDLSYPLSSLEKLSLMLWKSSLTDSSVRSYNEKTFDVFFSNRDSRLDLYWMKALESANSFEDLPYAFPPDLLPRCPLLSWEVSLLDLNLFFSCELWLEEEWVWSFLKLFWFIWDEFFLEAKSPLFILDFPLLRFFLNLGPDLTLLLVDRALWSSISIFDGNPLPTWPPC